MSSIVERAAKRIRQQPLGERLHELIRPAHQRLAQIVRAVQARVPSGKRPVRVETRPQSDRARAMCRRRRNSRAQTRADRGCRGTRSTSGSTLCAAIFSRTVRELRAGVPSSSGSASTFGGGAAGGVPVMCSRMNAPRSTGDVRFGYAAAIRIAPLPSKPQRVGVVELHALEPLALDASRCRTAARRAR